MSWSSAGMFYHQLGTLVKAGLPMAQALDHAAGATAGRHAERARHWSDGCAHGRGLAEQLRADHEPAMATALVEAGEASGRLPDLCFELGRFYDHLCRVRSQTIARLAYPVVLGHVALVIPAVPAVFLGRSPWWSMLIGPAIVWGLVLAGAVVLVVARRSGLAARLALTGPGRVVAEPLIVANSALVIGAGLTAGMLVPRALELAADGCGNRVMARRLRDAAGDVATGRTPDLTAALAKAGFPAVTVQLIANGERTGTTEQALARAAEHARASFEERLAWAGRIVVSVIYTLAMALAVWQILAMFNAIYAPVFEMIEEDG
ncbi:MAG TPA: type II secretion system F family protein [Planctomycetota bacterium]|nr:type II secretion system F family protein [Planctomycetota bacterium]